MTTIRRGGIGLRGVSTTTKRMHRLLLMAMVAMTIVMGSRSRGRRVLRGRIVEVVGVPRVLGAIEALLRLLWRRSVNMVVLVGGPLTRRRRRPPTTTTTVQLLLLLGLLLLLMAVAMIPRIIPVHDGDDSISPLFLRTI